MWVLDVDKPTFCSLEMEVCPSSIKETSIPGMFVLKGFVKSPHREGSYIVVTCFINEDISDDLMPELKPRIWKYVRATINQHQRRIYRRGKVITDARGNEVLEDKIIFNITNVRKELE